MHHNAGTGCIPRRHHPFELEPDPVVFQVFIEEQLTPRVGADERVDHEQILGAVLVKVRHDRGIPTVLALDGQPSAMSVKVRSPLLWYRRFG